MFRNGLGRCGLASVLIFRRAAVSFRFPFSRHLVLGKVGILVKLESSSFRIIRDKSVVRAGLPRFGRRSAKPLSIRPPTEGRINGTSVSQLLMAFGIESRKSRYGGRRMSREENPVTRDYSYRRDMAIFSTQFPGTPIIAE